MIVWFVCQIGLLFYFYIFLQGAARFFPFQTLILMYESEGLECFTLYVCFCCSGEKFYIHIQLHF